MDVRRPALRGAPAYGSCPPALPPGGRSIERNTGQADLIPAFSRKSTGRSLQQYLGIARGRLHFVSTILADDCVSSPVAEGAHGQLDAGSNLVRLSVQLIHGETFTSDLLRSMVCTEL